MNSRFFEVYLNCAAQSVSVTRGVLQFALCVLHFAPCALGIVSKALAGWRLLLPTVYFIK